MGRRDNSTYLPRDTKPANPKPVTAVFITKNKINTQKVIYNLILTNLFHNSLANLLM